MLKGADSVSLMAYRHRRRQTRKPGGLFPGAATVKAIVFRIVAACGGFQTYISGSFCVSKTAAMGIPKFEAGPQKSVFSSHESVRFLSHCAMGSITRNCAIWHE